MSEDITVRQTSARPTQDRPVDRHVRRAQGSGGHAWCACGKPWPCPRSYEGRWQALKDWLGEMIAAHEAGQKVNTGQVAGMHQSLAASHRSTLGRMTQLEARDG